MLSGFGTVTGVRLINVPDKEFASFILVHFNDAAAVSNVLQKKNNIIIDECRFNISEPKVKNDESNPKIEKKANNRENRTIKISNIEPCVLVNGMTADDFFQIKADVINGRLQQRNTGKTPFSTHIFHMIKVKETFRYSLLNRAYSPILRLNFYFDDI